MVVYDRNTAGHVFWFVSDQQKQNVNLIRRFHRLFNIRRNAGSVGADINAQKRLLYCQWYIFGQLRPQAQSVGSCLHSPQNLEIAADDQWQCITQHQDAATPRKGLGLDDELAADVGVSVGGGLFLRGQSLGDRAVPVRQLSLAILCLIILWTLMMIKKV